jgi:hypothetical protein
MKLSDRIADIARNEIRNPKLDSVVELLAKFSVVRHRGIPALHKIKFKDDRTCYVYFPIEGHPYFLIVAVRIENGAPVASHAFIESLSNVCLTVTSPSLSSEELTAVIGLPQRYPLELDRYTKRPPNRWFYEPLPEAPGRLEEKLDFLLDSISEAAPRIKLLSDTCDVCLFVHTVSLMSWSLSRNAMERLGGLGARVELAVDFYLPFPEFLLEKMMRG